MAAAMNGMALHGGVIPYGGTFLVFSDYCRPAIRLSALQQVARHLCDDPRFDRPRRGRPDPPAGRASDEPAGDAQSRRLPPGRRGRDGGMLGAGAGAAATGPSLLALTRQNLPQLRTERADNLCARGAYRLRAAAGRAQGGADRHRLRGRARGRRRRGAGRAGDRRRRRLDALLELFDAQDAAYRADLLPGDALARLDRGGRDDRLGALYRPRRPRYRHRPVRRLGARPRTCSSASASPPRRSCRRIVAALEPQGDQ